MSTSIFFLLCLQALLIQNAYSQWLNRGLGYSGLALDAEAVSSSLGALNGYGPYGYGNTGLVGAGLDVYGYGINGIGYGAGLPLGYGAGWPVGYGAGWPVGYGAGVPSVAATASIPVAGPFVSNGFGELAVGGDFAVGGTTVVGGQIPVIGAVSFGGQIPAGGVVSIAGNCGCASIPL